MRKLSIKRRFAVASFFDVLDVYVSDAVFGEKVINKEKYRYLGSLKNGGELTCKIQSDACKIVVVPKNANTGAVFETYTVASGLDPVVLTGKKSFNPGMLNPFVFDCNTPNETKKRRERSRAGWIVFSITAAVGVLIGLLLSLLFHSSLFAPDKRFSWSLDANGDTEAFSVTLDGDFRQYSHKKLLLYASDNTLTVTVSRARFEELKEQGYSDLSLVGYASATTEGYGVQAGLQYNDKRAWVSFTLEETSYRQYFYEGTDSYWVILFSYPTAKERSVVKELEEILQTVTVFQ